MRLANNEGGLRTADILSIFGTEAQKADTKAFKALMRHLREVDGDHSTVIMVQVENEVGVLGDSRDRSTLAEEHFSAPVPAKFLDFLSGDWSSFTDAFQRNLAGIRQQSLHEGVTWKDLSSNSKRIDEVFMAYHYALYLEQVASAGKEVYPLPLYTNVWQNYGDSDADTNTSAIAAGGSDPGDYPSGGGVVDVLDVWKAFAPSLDLIAPDIYLNDYANSCKKYRHKNQPLLIPEQRRDEYGALRVWVAFGSYQALGTAPFGIGTVKAAECPFTKHYGLLAKMSHHVLSAQARGNASIGFFFDELATDGADLSPPIETTFGDWNLRIERSFVFGRPSVGSGMIIHVEGDQFLFLGWGFQVIFKHRSPKAHFTGLLKYDEIEVQDKKTGTLRRGRMLGGDETRSGQFAIMPSEDPDYGGFPISITIPARTGIAMCQPYALLDM